MDRRAMPSCRSLVILLLLVVRDAAAKAPAETWMTTPQLLDYWRFPSETHSVKTEDGFLLEVHRVTGPQGASGAHGRVQDKTPVLIQVGWATNSESAVLRDHDTLAVMLANLGYDVWLGNFRGSAYGRRHVSLSTKDEKFWDFGWHENGVHDLRAVIDYMLIATAQPSVVVAGHSMGATALLVLLAERPEYNAKVRVGFLIAPAAYMHHVRGLFLDLKRHLAWADGALSSLKIENPLTMAAAPLCLTANRTQVDYRCFNLLAHTQGPFYKSNYNNTYVPIFLGHFPVGSSVRQFIHFMQGIWRGGDFKKFDFGTARNRIEYGSPSPPPYNLQNVVSPMYIFYSENDYLTHYKDVEKLARTIPGTAGLFKIPLKIFNHIDIMYDEAAADLVFKRLIDLLKNY